VKTIGLKLYLSLNYFYTYLYVEEQIKEEKYNLYIRLVIKKVEQETLNKFNII